ncbi:MAG TPA: hypothetical protein VM511_09730, partial [Luteolibacter sp.]|nr:hypothetical protein [Luteolibacter sp.]
MKSRTFLLTRLLFGAALLVSPRLAAADFHWADIVIYGDSPSAVSAAIELAESGHDLILVSPTIHV